MKHRSLFLGLLTFAMVQYSFAGIEDRIHRPFALPQTNFVVGFPMYRTTVTDPLKSGDTNFPSGSGRMYGFEIETNWTRYLNIGTAFKFENLSKVIASEGFGGFVYENKIKRFSTVLGGFVKAHYTPQILHQRGTTANLFTRLDLGFGPAFINTEQGGYHAGVFGQTSAHIGGEYYINKWVGIGLSYGRLIEYGRDTLGDDGKVITFKSSGSITTVSVKTTLF